MRMHITRTSEAEHWFERVTQALVGCDKALRAYEEQVRVATIAEVNQRRRWVPFKKPLPLDTPLNEVEKHIEWCSDYWYVHAAYIDRKSRLRQVFHGLLNMINLHAGAITVSSRDVQLINLYAEPRGNVQQTEGVQTA